MRETPEQRKAILAKAKMASAPKSAEDRLWLAPLSRCVLGDPEHAVKLGQQVFSCDEYLRLVDLSGRIIRDGKRGRIPPELAPILRRLDLRIEAWRETLTGWRMMTGTLGHAASRAVEATRRQLQWVRNRCPLFVRDAVA